MSWFRKKIAPIFGYPDHKGPPRGSRLMIDVVDINGNKCAFWPDDVRVIKQISAQEKNLKHTQIILVNDSQEGYLTIETDVSVGAVIAYVVAGVNEVRWSHRQIHKHLEKAPKR